MSPVPPPAPTSPGLPPAERIELLGPPALPSPAPSGGALLGALPALGGLGSLTLVAGAGAAGGRAYAAAGLFALTSLGLVLVQLERQRTQRVQQVAGPRTAYLRYLGTVRHTLHLAATAQRQTLTRRHPPPCALPVLAEEGSRVWERTAGEADFLQVRYGVGWRPPALALTAPEPDPLHEADPVAAAALQRLVAAHRTQPDLPCLLDLGSQRLVALSGPAEEVRAAARAILCSAAIFHSPDDLLVAVLAEDRTPWEWLVWLPHALSPRAVDAAGRRRLVTGDPVELAGLLPLGLQEGAGEPPPHLVLVADGTAPPDRLLQDPGVTVLVLDVDPGDRQPASLRVCRPDPSELPGTLDACGLATAEALARRLARQHGRLVPATRRGAAGPAGRPWEEGEWQPRPDAQQLRVRIGATADGTPVELDLKEAARGGVGPHGLVVGATGSGKSELLRTLVLGLARSHSPRDLNLVLVDYKGGATFAGLAGLPHVSALVTNLADDAVLVERMHDVLSGELVRRQELLRAAGGLPSAHALAQARHDGADLPPLPSLLVVVDEFSELLTAEPGFVDLFVTIGRLGRSLGLHLLLASQRLEEGRLRGLEAHLSFRVGLRTFSAAESVAVLGVPDAHGLPARPGAAYLRTDPATLVRFTAAYVSGPMPTDPPAARPTVQPWTTRAVDPPDPPRPRPSGSTGTVLEAAAGAMCGHGPPAHRIWLPPLETPPTLDALLPGLTTDPRRGLTAGSTGGPLVVPVGTIDLPREQRHGVLCLDLGEAGGQVAVIGGPQSGKSTLLCTLVAGLALTATPREVQVLVLDLGGGSVAALEGLPHVIGVGDRSRPETARRVVAEVRGILDRREALFGSHGIDSMATYRERRVVGQVDDGYGDVLVVVDGWTALGQEFGDLAEELQSLSLRAPGRGVHLAVAATRWSDLRGSLREVFGTRLELRLGDPLDSEVDRRAAALVPRGRPGRGLLPGPRHFLTALPRIDGQAEPGSLATGVDDLVRRVVSGWPGAAAPRLRLLPARVTLEDVRRTAHPRTSGLLLGLGERDLGPVRLDLDADPHLLVLGEGRSGKSGCLRSLLRELVRTRSPAQAQVVLVDPRRTLAGTVPEDYLLHQAASGDQVRDALDDLAAYLTHRLPGPSVTTVQLRERSWWSGAEAFVVVDDHDLVAEAGCPLQALQPLLGHAADIGLHVLLARRSGGVGRALYQPVLQSLRDLAGPTLLLSGSPGEGPVVGDLRLSPAAAGRGRLVTRERGVEMVQVAWTEPGC